MTRNIQQAEVSRRMWNVAPLFRRQEDTLWSSSPTTPPTRRIFRTELEESVNRLYRGRASPVPLVDIDGVVNGPIRGVSWVPVKQEWEAHVEVNGNRRALGFYKEKYDAVRTVDRALIVLSVDRALIVLSKEYAVTNYPLSDYVDEMEQLEMWTIEELQEALKTDCFLGPCPWRAGSAPDPKDVCRSSGPLGLPYFDSPSKKLSELQLNKACNKLAKPRRVFIEDSDGSIQSHEKPPPPWRMLKDQLAAAQAKLASRSLAEVLADIATPSISTDTAKQKTAPWKAGSLSDPSVKTYNSPSRDHPKLRNIHAERATSIIKQALVQKSDIGHATCDLCPVPCDLCLRQKMRRAFRMWRLVTFYELETPQPEWRVPGAAPDLDCVYLSSPLEPHVPLSPSWDTPRNV